MRHEYPKTQQNTSPHNERYSKTAHAIINAQRNELKIKNDNTRIGAPLEQLRQKYQKQVHNLSRNKQSNNIYHYPSGTFYRDLSPLNYPQMSERTTQDSEILSNTLHNDKTDRQDQTSNLP